jgi:hypothetical protein
LKNFEKILFKEKSFFVFLYGRKTDYFKIYFKEEINFNTFRGGILMKKILFNYAMIIQNKNN